MNFLICTELRGVLIVFQETKVYFVALLLKLYTSQKSEVSQCFILSKKANDLQFNPYLKVK